MADNNKKKKKNRVLGYFKDVKGELKKVVWPSFKQVKNNTLIVIACVLIIGAFIWILDGIFGLSLGKVVEKMQEPETKVEQQAQPQAGQPAGDTLTEEDIAKMLKDEYAKAGVDYDIEANTFKDIESGAELTKEEADAKLEEYTEKNSTDTEVTGEAATETSETTGEVTTTETPDTNTDAAE